MMHIRRNTSSSLRFPSVMYKEYTPVRKAALSLSCSYLHHFTNDAYALQYFVAFRAVLVMYAQYTPGDGTHAPCIARICTILTTANIRQT